MRAGKVDEGKRTEKKEKEKERREAKTKGKGERGDKAWTLARKQEARRKEARRGETLILPRGRPRAGTREKEGPPCQRVEFITVIS